MTFINSKNIVIWGDFMLDIVVKVSSKSDVNINGIIPTFLVKKYNYMAGGAGTVARLLISTGSFVNCIGLIGDDWAGLLLHKILSKKNKQEYLFVEHTNTRVRIYVDDEKRLFMRFDIEGADKNTTYKLLKKNIANSVISTDILAILDYNKGCLDYYSSSKIKAKKYTIASVKHKNIVNYLDADILVVNAKEQIDAKNKNRKIKERDIYYIISNIRKRKYINELIITCGSQGLYYESSEGKLYYFPPTANHVENTIGCGDTFIAGLLLGLHKNESILDSVSMGSYYAGLAAGYEGIAMPMLLDIKSFDSKEVQKVRKR